MPEFPGLGGSFCVDAASTPASSSGVSFSTGAANNTKAAWVTLIAATAGATQWVSASVVCNLAGGRNAIDIGIGPSGSEVVVISNLYADVIGATSQTDLRTYLFPIVIPAGVRVAVRGQCTSASQTAVINLQLISSPLTTPSTYNRVESVGVTTSGGTRLTPVDPGGTPNVLGTITQLIAATSFDYHWLNIAFGHGSSGTGLNATYLVDILIGASGQERVLIPGLFIRNHTGLDTIPTVFKLPCYVPVGSRLSARIQSSDASATSRIQDVGLWGCG